jgi:IS66 C-terminal element
VCRPLGRRSRPDRASTPARLSRRRASARRAPAHPTHAAHSGYDAPAVRTADATDTGLQHPARYGQNDREIALSRKNALFAGSDGGAEHWAVVASLIESCKLNAVDPQAYRTDVITKIVNGHLNSRIDELLPWAYAVNQPLKDVA